MLVLLKVLRHSLAQPIEDDSQFAVFESATRWFLGNTWAVPLAEVGLRGATR